MTQMDASGFPTLPHDPSSESDQFPTLANLRYPQPTSLHLTTNRTLNRSTQPDDSFPQLTEDSLSSDSANYSVNHSVNHSINHSINHSVNHSINHSDNSFPELSSLESPIRQSINRHVSECVNRRVNDSINQPVNHPVNQSAGQPVNQSAGQPVNHHIVNPETANRMMSPSREALSHHSTTSHSNNHSSNGSANHSQHYRYSIVKKPDSVPCSIPECGETFNLIPRKQPYTIGREKQSVDWWLDSKKTKQFISRLHTRISYKRISASQSVSQSSNSDTSSQSCTTQHSWVIFDNKSSNGTYINGTRLPPSAPRQLCNGDLIEFGKVRDNEFTFVFVVDENAPLQPAQSSPASPVAFELPCAQTASQSTSQSSGSPSRRRSHEEEHDDHPNKRARVSESNSGFTREMIEEMMREKEELMRQKDEQIAMMKADAEKRAADQQQQMELNRRRQIEETTRIEQAFIAMNKEREEEAARKKAEKELIEQLQLEAARLAEERAKALQLSEAEKVRLAEETHIAQARLAEAQAQAEESRKIQEQQEAKEAKMKEEFNCSICTDYIFDGLLLSCSHAFCRECLMNMFRSNNTICPNCRCDIPFMYEPVPTLGINNTVEMLLDPLQLAEFRERKAKKSEEDAKNKRAAAALRSRVGHALAEAQRTNRPLSLLRIDVLWPQDDKQVFLSGITPHKLNDEARALYLELVGLTRESIPTMSEQAAVIACQNLGIADWIAPAMDRATGRQAVVTPQMKLAELRRRLWLYQRFGVVWKC